MTNELFFNKKDFELFKIYGGKNSSDCPPEAHKQLRVMYDKLGEIVDELKKFGFEVHIRRNPQNQGQKFEHYHWSQVYPKKIYDACYKKVFFVVGTTGNGFEVHIDSNSRDNFDSDSNLLAKKIKDSTWAEWSIDEIVSLTKEDIVSKILDYCREEYISLLRFGKEFKIQKCITELQNIDMINLLKANHNIILHGAPGTGKTYLANEIAKAMGAETEFVQFHPSMDYSDFVEGLRPFGSGEIGFRREDGIFKAFCKKALGSDKDFVFIIDEINRGDLSKIFGELFFSIDSGYRGDKVRIKTQYQNLVDKETDEQGNEKEDVFKKGFYVPKNVYIIGTMNDIDRSVESMDFAMRRRFAFVEITAEQSAERMLNTENSFKAVVEDFDDREEHVALCMGEAENIKNRMANLNEAIVSQGIGLTKDYQIGAAYFLKYALYAKDENPYEQLWRNHIEGVLKEYLRGTGDEEEKMKKLKAGYNNASAKNS